MQCNLALLIKDPSYKGHNSNDLSIKDYTVHGPKHSVYYTCDVLQSRQPLPITDKTIVS